MKTILFATDLSLNSKHAIRYAHNLLKDEAQRYVFFHSYVDPSLGSQSVYPFQNAMLDSSKAALASFVEELGTEMDFSGLETLEEVRYGEFVYAVRDVLVRESVDLAVLGASGASNSFFGSNSYSAMKELSVPVLTVPLQSKVKSPEHIGIATETALLGDEPHLGPVFQLSKMHQSKVIGLKVNKDELAEVGTSVDADLPCVELPSQDVVMAIVGAVGEYGLDMLVLPLKRRSWLEDLFHRSISRELAAELKLPLLTTRRM